MRICIVNQVILSDISTNARLKMAPLLVVLIVSLLTRIASSPVEITFEGRTLSKDVCDEKLASAIGFFIGTTQGVQHNYLLWLLGLERDGVQGVEAVNDLNNRLHLDLTDPSQQREMAIILCHSPHLTFLSRMFNVSFERMDRFVHHYIKKVRVGGEVSALIELGEISMELLAWAQKTGYPVTPLENTDAEEAMNFLEDIDDRVGSDRSVLHLWQKSNRHFPVGAPYDLNFKNVAFKLISKNELGDLAAFLGLPYGELQVLSDLDDQVLDNYISNVAATMRLYKIMDEYGILDLDWD